MILPQFRVLIAFLLFMFRFLNFTPIVHGFRGFLSPTRLSRLSFSSTSDAQPGLYASLRLWRSKMAEELKKPVYYILSNNAIEAINVKMPTTLQQLSDIPGIGPVKLKSFGSAILRIVKDSHDVKPEPPPNSIPDEAFLDIVETKVQEKKAKKKAKNAISNGSLVTSRRKRGGISMLSPEAIAAMNVPGVSRRDLNVEKRRAAELVLAGNNMFITGNAGTGKTFLLKYVIQELIKKHGEASVGVTAPTGIAAIAVGGQTIHSFSGIGLGKGEAHKLIAKVKADKNAVDRWSNCSVLIIDEVSMLSVELFELLDNIARDIRKNNAPFGGLQLVVVGDFLQLPPVHKDSGAHFCFQSPLWEAAGLNGQNNSIHLTTVERQSDPVFVKHLNDVRKGKLTPEFSQLLNKCLIQHKPPPSNGIVPTKLYAINKEVDGENMAQLAVLPGQIVTMVAEDFWATPPVKTPLTVLKAGIEKVIPEKIELKVGAQVMLLRNRNWQGGSGSDQLVNGSRGKIIRFEESVLEPGKQIPLVHFDNGVVDTVNTVDFEYKAANGDGKLVRKQIPLKLAWAATIHKSQGCTLSCAELMLGSSFDYGQAYVALSRVKGLEGLWLTAPVKASSVKAHPDVLDFYNRTEKQGIHLQE